MEPSRAEEYLSERYFAEFERALVEFNERGLRLASYEDRTVMADELREAFLQAKRWRRA